MYLFYELCLNIGLKGLVVYLLGCASKMLCEICSVGIFTSFRKDIRPLVLFIFLVFVYFYYFEENEVRLHFALSERIAEEMGCRKIFNTTIAGYLAVLSKQMYPCEEEVFQKVPKIYCLTSFQVNADDFSSYCTKILLDEISPNIFRVVTKLVESRKRVRENSSNLSGPLYNPPLEFVNSLCKVIVQFALYFKIEKYFI